MREGEGGLVVYCGVLWSTVVYRGVPWGAFKCNKQTYAVYSVKL
jgi:hypothetical protein